MKKRAWRVYVARVSKPMRVFRYTGISTDVEARIEAHRKGKGARACKGALRITLEWVSANTYFQGEALRLEAAIKKLPARSKAHASELDRLEQHRRG